MRGLIFLVLCIHQTYTQSWRIRGSTMKYQILEGSPIGSTLGEVSEQISTNGVKYKFGAPSQLFLVNPVTSELTLKAELDAEKLCALANRRDVTKAGSYNYGGPIDVIECSLSTGKLTVTLDINVFHSDDSLEAVLKAIVEIIDVEDNPPQFDQPIWQRRLKEALYRKGRRIDLPKAHDADIMASHRLIQYRLESGSHEAMFHFEMNGEDTPSLILKQDLDAETQENFNMTLVAYNAPLVNQMISTFPTTLPQTGISESKLKVELVVVDMNDNEPYFEKTNYNITIPEDTPPGSLIFQLKAFDLDRTSRLTYSLETTEEQRLGDAEIEKIFAVATTGEVTLLQRLDFEIRQKYKLPVQVTDGEFLVDATLIVQVGDVNDEAPRFEVNPKNLAVEEGALIRKSIGQVRVFDPDSRFVNGLVQCAEPPEMARRQALAFVPDLKVNPSAGVYDLQTRMELDREGDGAGRHLVKLICWDGNGAGISLTSTMTATLTIRDVNDNPPEFTDEVYRVSVPENNNVGTRIIQVIAYDPDEGVNSEISYSLLDHANFHVDPTSGWVSAAIEFDREKRDSYQVTIVASDNGHSRLKSSALLDITVTDVNDNIPHLLPCREAEKEANGNQHQQGNRLQIRENAPVGSFVGQLMGEDADVAENGRINFRLLRRHGLASAAHFDLHSNGTIFSAMPLDREEQSNYQLMVEVSDMAQGNSLSSTGSICIDIMDENDNDPHFVLPDGLYSLDQLLYDQLEYLRQASYPIYKSKADETIPISQVEPSIRLSIHEISGQLVTRLEATDPDEGKNGEVEYDLRWDSKSPFKGDFLTADKKTGEVRLKQSLKKNDMGVHTFIVSARDKGQPSSRSENKLLLVSVEDIPARSLSSAGGATSSFKASLSSMSLLSINWGNLGSGKNVLLLTALISISVILAIILVVALVCMLRPSSCVDSRRRQRACTTRLHNGRPMNGGPSHTCPTIVPMETRLIDSSADKFPGGLHDYGYGGSGGYGGAEFGEMETWEGTHNSFPGVTSTNSITTANKTIMTNGGLSELRKFSTLHKQSVSSVCHEENSHSLNDENEVTLPELTSNCQPWTKFNSLPREFPPFSKQDQYIGDLNCTGTYSPAPQPLMEPLREIDENVITSSILGEQERRNAAIWTQASTSEVNLGSRDCLDRFGDAPTCSSACWSGSQIAVPIKFIPTFCVSTSSINEGTGEECLALSARTHFLNSEKIDQCLLNEREGASDSGQGGSDEELHKLNRPPIISLVHLSPCRMVQKNTLNDAAWRQLDAGGCGPWRRATIDESDLFPPPPSLNIIPDRFTVSSFSSRR